MKIYEIKTAQFFEIEPKRTAGEEQMQCPKCSQDRRKSKAKCFSWNHSKQVGHCQHCDSSFVIKQERREEKAYVRPVFNNNTSLSEKVVKWFQGRGISQDTLVKMKITEGPEWMPQTQAAVNTIQFNYFRNGKLINTKFRDGAKNFKMIKDAELIFFNLDAIANQKEIIITEGEIDALSWIEAGCENVVSVPNGAATGGKMDYLDNCFEYFEGKTKIYLSTDNDPRGIELRDELARRLGVERCYKINFGNLKDANEYLQAYTPDKLKALLSQASEFPIEGIYSVNETWQDIEDIYFNGLPKGSKTGDPQMDSHIGFMPGELTTITGIPGHGKSIFLDQISLGLAISSGWKFGICSPESYPLAFYFTRLIKRITGKKFHRNNITLAQLHQVKEWLSERYFMIMPQSGYSLDEILSRARQLVLRKGINALILDPWNRIEKNKPNGMDEGSWIVLCLTKIIEFAQKSGVHVFLVAHPTKMQKEKDGINFTVPNLYSISGSAHFFNITHNGMTIFRNYVSGKTEAHIQKVKWEHLGKVGLLEYTYNEENARFDDVLRSDYSDWMETKILGKSVQTTIDHAIQDLLDMEREPPF